MNKKILTILAGLLLAPAAMADTPEIVPAHPVVWHIKGAHGAQITLFGSLHVLPANMNWLTPDILGSIMHSDVFVFEVATDDGSQVTLKNLIDTYGSLPQGQSLRALLPPDSQSDYDTALTTAHLSPDVINREQPWLVSLQLTLADSMNRNYFPDAGCDYVLMNWANTHNRRVRYLETVDQQFRLLIPSDNSLRLDEFENDLKGVGREHNQITPLVTAWSDGDVQPLNTLMDGSFANHPEDKKKLLTDRNKHWAAQIEKMVDEGHNFFITVGAAHLAGPDGVPALLRADGIEVDGP